MSRIFISHSSKNDDVAIALKMWLIREGWSGENDIFLDLDPERGIAAGERWRQALEEAATRCEAVLFLVSEDWLSSKWCADEYQLAAKLDKKIFALLIDDIALERLPGGLSAQWQVVHLKGEPAERFIAVHPYTQQQSPVHLATAGLASLKRGLQKAGIGAETFELQPDPTGPFGWRAPYRGLEALEPEDAAVFFGRSADIMRGMDGLRGLASRPPPRLLVILGASGAGKSSFLRAGLWPRLNRDDTQWLPLRAIRAGRGGAIEGTEGLLAALEELHRRFALRMSRADLRARIATPEAFVALLAELRQAAARRALLTAPPFPLPVLCLDQAEEVFAADSGAESERLLHLARAAIEADAALLLATIRSDSYGLMQNATVLAGLAQAPFSLGPVPSGEIARIIREPAEILRRKVGPAAPVFDPAVIARLQEEVAGEADALPLLAFVLQRLMREHEAAGTIGLQELEATGGVAEAIEWAAEAALADAGFGPERSRRRAALRRLFIPRLARVDRDSKAFQRRITRQADLPADLLPLARALTERRLLVAKAAAQVDGAQEETSEPAATLEVAHEALLRKWPTLAELLTQDRDALLLLDGVLTAAVDWAKAEDAKKPDYLAHRGSRLADAQALAARGPDWAREIAPAQDYLAACQEREAAERAEKEAALAREQERLAERAEAQKRTAKLQRRARRILFLMAVIVALGLALGVWQYRMNLRRQAQLDIGHVNLLTELATAQRLHGNLDSALRFSVHAVRLGGRLDQKTMADPLAQAALATTAWQSRWRLVLSGHQGSVNSAAFGPDGTRIVTASADGTARIWDAVTGKQLVVLRGHKGVVHSAAFSPDGKRVVMASWDKTARIWDAKTGKELMVLRGHTDSVNSAAFSPDGTRIVTASDDKTARIWDAATGRQIAVLRGHTGSVLFAAFNPDGKRIVTASEDMTARIWDAATGKELMVLRGHNELVASAAFSPGGKRIVTAQMDNTARIWDAATGKQLMVLRGHTGAVLSVAFSPDGKRIVTASWDNTARVWDAATGKELMVLRGHESPVQSAVFSPDGKHIVTASADFTARIWDAAIGRQLMVLRGHTGYVNSAAFSPDGKRIVTASAYDTARIWDARSGRELMILRGHQSVVRSAAFSPDGKRIVTASFDKTARIWDAVTGKVLMVLRGHTNYVMSAVYSRDGKRIVTASQDGTARIWDAATGKELTVLHGHKGEVWSATFSPDGKRIITVAGKTLRVWDVATGKQVALVHEACGAHSVAFSPDGSRMVVACFNGAAWIYDARGKAIALRGHKLVVWSAAFSPDGNRVVTASFDKTARIWDAATGNQVAVLRGHTAEVSSAAFSPDGRRVVTASNDGTARIWDVHLATMPTKDLIKEVCARPLRGISTMTRDEMRLAGYPDRTPLIDVCKGVAR